MTNFVANYTRDFGEAKEINYISNPFRDLSDYYLGKVVFTGERFENLDLEKQEEIYDSAMLEFSPISEDTILVLSIIQGTGTEDPTIIIYTFDITAFSIFPIDNPNSLYEAGPAGIPKEIKKIGEKRIIKLPIKNNPKQDTPKLQVLVQGFKEKLEKLFRSN